MSTSTVVRKLSLALWLLSCMAVISAVSLAAYYLAPSTQHFSITEQYLISVTGPETAVYLGVLLPRDGPYQKVQQPSIVWHGGVALESSPYADVLKMEGAAGAQSKVEAVIDYEVTLRRGWASWQAPVEPFQYEPQTNVESDHPLLQSAAKSVATGAGRDDARRLYRLTAGLLDWPEESRSFIDASALNAYRTGIGTCGEFANLLVALCRASGIPAQTIIGLWLPEMGPYSTAGVRSLNHPGESHAWTEFYAGGRWEMADASSASQNEQWSPFGWIDGRHLSYGEAGQLSISFGETRKWAEENGPMIGGMFGTLKFVASAGNEEAIVTPRVTMKKGWDGRWLNLLIGWTVTMLLVQRLNMRRVRAARVGNQRDERSSASRPRPKSAQ